MSFKRDYNGPFSWEIIDAVEDLKGIVSVETYNTYYGTPGYRHWIENPILANEITKQIPSNAYEIGMYVVEEFRNLNLKDILNVVYKTPPMVSILSEEESLGHPIYERGINMAENKSVVFKPDKERLKAAQNRLNLEKRGSDEEYNAHFFGIIKSLEPYRRRATKCLHK